MARCAIEFLSKCEIIDFKKGELTGRCVLENLEETIEEPVTEIEKFSWKYGKKFHTTFKSYGQLLINAANWKRYSAEEYFDRILTECKKDKFWKEVITEEMVLRKIVFLNEKFGKNIPNNIGSMRDIESIF